MKTFVQWMLVMFFLAIELMELTSLVLPNPFIPEEVDKKGFLVVYDANDGQYKSYCLDDMQQIKILTVEDLSKLEVSPLESLAGVATKSGLYAPNLRTNSEGVEKILDIEHLGVSIFRYRYHRPFELQADGRSERAFWVKTETMKGMPILVPPYCRVIAWREHV